MFEISDLLDPETINKLNSLQYGKEHRRRETDKSNTPGGIKEDPERNGTGINKTGTRSEVVSNNKC